MERRGVTYNVSDVFRKCKTQNGEHALEGVLVLIDAIALRRDPSNTTVRWHGTEQGTATRTRQKGPVCLGNANIRGLV